MYESRNLPFFSPRFTGFFPSFFSKKIEAFLNFEFSVKATDPRTVRKIPNDMEIPASLVLGPEDALYICGTPTAFDRYYEEFPI